MSVSKSWKLSRGHREQLGGLGLAKLSASEDRGQAELQRRLQVSSQALGKLPKKRKLWKAPWNPAGHPAFRSFCRAFCKGSPQLMR